MPIPTREELKELFEDGDNPTQADRFALIDAMYDLAQDALDKATAALAAVTAAGAPFCQGSLRVAIANNYNGGAGGKTMLKLREKECVFTITHVGATQTSNPSSGPKSYLARFQVDVVFGVAQPDTTYLCNYELIPGKTTAGCSFYVDLPFLFLAPLTPLNETAWDNVTFFFWRP